MEDDTIASSAGGAVLEAARGVRGGDSAGNGADRMTIGRDGTVQEAEGKRNTWSTDLWLEWSRTRRLSADLWKLSVYGQEQVQEHAGQQLIPPKELTWMLGRTGSPLASSCELEKLQGLAEHQPPPPEELVRVLERAGSPWEHEQVEEMAQVEEQS